MNGELGFNLEVVHNQNAFCDMHVWVINKHNKWKLSTPLCTRFLCVIIAHFAKITAFNIKYLAIQQVQVLTKAEAIGVYPRTDAQTI